VYLPGLIGIKYVLLPTGNDPPDNITP